MEEITVGPTPVEIKRAEHNSGIHPKLVMVPAPELRQKCEPSNMNFVESLPLLYDVLRACINAGIITSSISAPQVGIRSRFFIINSPALTIECFNPLIVKHVGICQSVEGCLSFPRGVFYSVPRAKIIKFHYTDRHGIEHSLKLRDRYAAIVQHEIDHLDGILMDDNGLPCRE